VGVHYPGDVAAGALIGVVVAVGAVILLKWASKHGFKTASALTHSPPTLSLSQEGT
jgi:membrane-associated phospholipid phosphatase